MHKLDSSGAGKLSDLHILYSEFLVVVSKKKMLAGLQARSKKFSSPKAIHLPEYSAFI